METCGQHQPARKDYFLCDQNDRGDVHVRVSHDVSFLPLLQRIGWEMLRGHRLVEQQGLVHDVDADLLAESAGGLLGLRRYSCS